MKHEDFYSMIVRFLRDASAEPSEVPVAHLASAIGRSFFPWRVAVSWRAPEHGGPIYEALWPSKPKSRAYDDSKYDIPAGETEWKRSEHRIGTLALTDLDNKHGFPVGLIIYEISDAGKTSASAEVGGKLWIIFQPVTGPVSKTLEHRVREFRKSVTDLRALYNGFKALLAASKPAQPAEIAKRVAELAADTGESFLARLDKAISILNDIRRGWQIRYKEKYSALIARLSEAIMLEMLGTGWDVENLEGQRGLDRVEDFLDCLQPFVEDLTFQGRLRAITTIIRTVICGGKAGEREQADCYLTEDTEAKHGETLALALMARWTRVHQLSRRLARSSEFDRDAHEDSVFFEAVEQSIEPVDCFLQEHIGRGSNNPGGFKATYLPSWLRLWFCHGLLVHTHIEKINRDVSSVQESGDERSISKAQQWRFRADLSYVIRESLRLFAYSKEPHLIFQPVVFSAALRTLVEYHAIWIVKLPRELDVRGLLREIGRISLGGGPYFASGHQQHVLEMYIGGQFLCDVRMDFEKQAEDGEEHSNGESPTGERPEEAPWLYGNWTLGEILAGRSGWQPGALKTGEFRKAFSLAVLLHDVGLLLFPQWTHRSEQLGEVDTTLRKNLRSIRRSLHTSAGELLRVCERELLEEGYFDPTLEPRLAAWIHHAIENGDADHCLLGAWYLHRMCQEVEGLSSDLMYQAVRAILLHRIVTQKIKVDDDPAAALLVLCDAIFMWHQSDEDPQPDEVGRFFHAIAGEVRPQSSHFHSLLLNGLKLERQEIKVAKGEPVKRLIGVLTVDKSTTLATRQGAIWPYFDITLRDSDYLRTPIYCIWLAMAQNLGRIEASKCGWGPALTLRSKISGRMENARLSTHRILELAANQTRRGLRPSLERWLGNKAVFPKEKAEAQDDQALVAAISATDERKVENSTVDTHNRDVNVDNIAKIKSEEVNILPVRNFHNQDIVSLFPELEQIIESVFHEEMLRYQLPPNGPFSREGDDTPADGS